jgi:hypothetical protein
MEVIGSIASVAQIAGQLVDLGQKILVARQSVRQAPKAIKHLDAQLLRLDSTAKQVMDEPQLQMPIIHDQLVEIYAIAMELGKVIDTMRKAQGRSRSAQVVRTLFYGQRDEAALRDILGRLSGAQDALSTRISVAHVGTTSGVAKTAERIEQRVETIRKDMKSTVKQRFVIERNTVQESTQENSIVVAEESVLSMATISENKALNDSQQSNSIILGPSSHRPSRKGFLTA